VEGYEVAEETDGFVAFIDGMNPLCTFPRIRLQIPEKYLRLFSDWLSLLKGLFSGPGK